MSKQYSQFRIYKPTKKENGAASALQLRAEKGQYGTNHHLFWQAAKQTGTDENGNATIGWKEDDKNASMKLGPTDVGELLAVLNKNKPECKLFHQNPKGNTTLNLKFAEGKGYYVALGAKREGQSLVQVKHTISIPEAELLKALLTRVVSILYNW